MIWGLSLALPQGPPGGKVRARDRGAWDDLVVREHGRIFNLHLRLTGDREAAADLTQETFVAAYQSAHTYAAVGRPEAWLYGVALNCSRQWYRKSGRQEAPDELNEALPDPQPTAEELAILRERSDLVCSAVQRLPELYRRVVTLRYFAGVSAAEIASTDGVPTGTVRWRLHQGLKKLWVMLAPELGKES
jgi:RNA polymerase sigma-70 factor, ECF subfamily